MSRKTQVGTFVDDYQAFVMSVLSDPSMDLEVFITRLRELEAQGAKPQMLLTAEAGLSAEAGEFVEIVKKIMYQGKPYDEHNIFHMKRELSDVCFYLMVACIALNYDLDDIIEENIRKLQARYPDGFEVSKSEKRKDGDL